MAKKSFGVRSSLSVQPKQISPDEVEKAIQKIHQAEAEVEQPKVSETIEQPVSVQKKKSKPAAKKPTASKKKSKPVPSKKEPVKRKVRLSVDVTPEIHKRLKIRAIEKDSDIMRYVAMLIERDLNKK